MGLLFESIFLDVVGVVYVLGVVIAILYWQLTSHFVYWKDKGVPYLQPEPFFGNSRNTILFRTPIGEVLQEFYRGLAPNEFGGYYAASRPVLMVRSLSLIQQICVKDFQHFHDRGFPVNEKLDPLSGHLFNLAGSRWRNLRVKLTPTFTTMRMKQMYRCVHECAKQLNGYLQRPAKYGEELEMKEILAKYTTDVIGTAAFGLKLNSLKNPNSEFRLMGRKLFETPSLGVKLKYWSMLFVPALARWFNATLASTESRQFFLKAVRETVEYRRVNNVVRDDFMQLLMTLQEKGRLEGEDGVDVDGLTVEGAHEEFTENMMAAQAFVFFVAGFETSSTTMSFCLHELAANPDVQVKVHEELDKVARSLDGAALTYEAIQNLTYLDKVIAETLRKYPPIPNLSRVCTKAYPIPGTKITLDPGTKVVIPIYAIHHDPEYYPDPLRFDPERFGEAAKRMRPKEAYIPFGEGPRMCIAMRFAQMQTKVGLAMILADFEVGVSAQTKIPLVLDPNGAVTTARGGTWMSINKRVKQEDL